MTEKEVQRFSFYHGLGDAANFSRLIPVYKKYGIDVEVKVTDDKKIIIEAAGGKALENDPGVQHNWNVQQGQVDKSLSSLRGWQGNKAGSNLQHFGLGL